MALEAGMKKVWIRKNGGVVCEVFHGANKPLGCEAPGTWSQVDETAKAVTDFHKAQEARFSQPTIEAQLLALLKDPNVKNFESERKKILGIA